MLWGERLVEALRSAGATEEIIAVAVKAFGELANPQRATGAPAQARQRRRAHAGLAKDRYEIRRQFRNALR